MSDVSEFLRDWRRASGVKQSTLAAMLGVSQSSVSRWERRIEQPSAEMLSQLRRLIHRNTIGELTRQQAITSRLPGMGILVDLDGHRILASTSKFKRIWPSVLAVEGMVFADHLTEVTRDLYHDAEFMRSVKRNEIAMVTGVSDRHVAGSDDNAFRHYWTANYRKIGTEQYIEFMFEPCEPDAVLGLRHVLRVDEIG